MTSPVSASLLSRLISLAYDPVSALGDRWFLASHRDALVDGLEGRILDLGAGTGWMFPYLAGVDGSLEVHAIEPDPYMRARARQRAASLELDVTFHAGVAEELPFRDESFDAALSSLVLCTVDDPVAARDELARVLIDDGEVSMLEHVRGQGLRGRLQEMVAPLWRPLAGGCHLDRSQHEPFLADPAFEVQTFQRLDIGLFPIKPFIAARFQRVQRSEQAEQRDREKGEP